MVRATPIVYVRTACAVCCRSAQTIAGKSDPLHDTGQYVARRDHSAGRHFCWRDDMYDTEHSRATFGFLRCWGIVYSYVKWSVMSQVDDCRRRLRILVEANGFAIDHEAERVSFVPTQYNRPRREYIALGRRQLPRADLTSKVRSLHK